MPIPMYMHVQGNNIAEDADITWATLERDWLMFSEHAALLLFDNTEELLKTEYGEVWRTNPFNIL
jgi:hypothetical protein